MHMYKTVGQEMRNKADADSRNFMLNNARNEAKADAAVSFSSRLDRIATYASVNQLSSVEIIEMLRQESEKFDHEGRAHMRGLTMDNRQCVEINNAFAIIKMKADKFIYSDRLILADVRTDKETKEKCYPTRAIYSSELKLVADLINLSVKRGVYLKTITSISGVMEESHRIAELGQQALNQLNNESEL